MLGIVRSLSIRGSLLVVAAISLIVAAVVFSDADYRAVRNLGDEYRKRNPRSVI